MKKIALLSFLFIIGMSFLFVNFTKAADLTGTGCSGSSCKLNDPLGLEDQGDKAPQVLIGKIIKGALGIVGSLALAMFIYGGFRWMLAAGNADAVKVGRDTMVWATIGLIIIFTAYALVTFVFTKMLGITA